MTHSELILSALQSGARLSPLEVWRDIGCARLAARVHELRKDGHPIESEIVESPTGARYAVYWLAAKQEALL